MKNIRKRAVLTVVALALFLGVVVYMTYAWFTKMTGVSATEFQVARWDFNANHQVDSFRVNVYEYQSVYGHNIAAPGTSGTLDLRLGAEASDSDVDCFIELDKAGMSEDFQKRIYFYCAGEHGELEEMVMGQSSVYARVEAGGYAIASIYWHWIYDYDEYLQMHEKSEYYVCSRILRPVHESRLGRTLSLDDLYMLSRYTAEEETTLAEVWSNGLLKESEDPVPEFWEGKVIYEYLKALMEPTRKALLKNESEVLGLFRSEALLSEIHADEPEAGVTTDSLDALLERYVFSGIPDWTAENLAYDLYFQPDSAISLGLDDRFGTYWSAYEEFDDFDTRVSANPDVFKQYMGAVVYVMGDQVVPEAVDPTVIVP